MLIILFLLFLFCLVGFPVLLLKLVTCGARSAGSPCTETVAPKLRRTKGIKSYQIITDFILQKSIEILSSESAQLPCFPSKHSNPYFGRAEHWHKHGNLPASASTTSAVPVGSDLGLKISRLRKAQGVGLASRKRTENLDQIRSENSTSQTAQLFF